MADYVFGTMIGAALFIALRHIYKNISSGRHDCCEPGGGCGTCQHCRETGEKNPDLP